MSQIRLQRSPELDRVLAFLRSKYRLLSEAEIIKMVLSERYEEDASPQPMKIKSEEEFRKMYEDLKKSGKKLGDKLLKEKGLRREDVTEEEFYNLIIDPKNAQNRP